MSVKSYDKLALNSGIVLDLPHFEGDKGLVRDISKYHHNCSIVGGVSWATSPGCLEYDGATGYMESPGADTEALDFMGDDYSICCWINWEDTGIAGEIVAGRYNLNNNGWELYLAWDGAVNSLTLRHSHAGTLVPPITGNPRSACYSVGWTRGVWCLLGVVRTGGGEAQHYRNGIALTMVTSGLVDPESCAEDLTIGVRYTKNATFYKGKMSQVRVWDRKLTAGEILDIFQSERVLYGV